jgi:hypothetical protein
MQANRALYSKLKYRSPPFQVRIQGTPPEPIYVRDSMNPILNSESLPTSIEGTEFFTNIGLESTLHYFPTLNKLDPEV